MTDAVLVERQEGWRRIVLNRPERLNAFNAEQHRLLLAALEEAERDRDCRALLLTGAGRAFCSGQDLSERRRKAGDPPFDLRAGLERGYNRLVSTIAALPLPVVCAVNGVAAGAGANLALACDIVVAARSAKFVQAFGKVGLIPDSGGTWLLPRLVGAARARALVMLAEPVTAETAESWGMIWRAVPDETLMAEAEATVAKLVALSPQALALSKQALAASAGNGLALQLALEAQLQGEAGRSEDYREGVEAFLEKRAPKFGKRP